MHGFTEYYSAIKMNELIIHATSWMDLEGVMLSEKARSQKVTFYMIPVI